MAGIFFLFPFRLIKFRNLEVGKKIEFREQSLSLHWNSFSLDENFGVLLKKPENSCASPFFRNIFGLFLVKSLRKLGFRNKDWLEFSKIPQIWCLEFMEKIDHKSSWSMVTGHRNKKDKRWKIFFTRKQILKTIFLLAYNRS